MLDFSDYVLLGIFFIVIGYFIGYWSSIEDRYIDSLKKSFDKITKKTENHENAGR